MQAGVRTGDRMWRLPLFEHYRSPMVEHGMADVNNIGNAGFPGMSCTAAGFLWVRQGHGPVLVTKWSDAVASLSANGSTAFIWKLCCHWLKSLRQHKIAVAIQALSSLDKALHIGAWTKWELFCWQYFQKHFCKIKILYFPEVCS